MTLLVIFIMFALFFRLGAKTIKPCEMHKWYFDTEGKMRCEICHQEPQR